MKIVIDIPNNMDLRNYNIPYDILKIITDGKPLPEHHGDLIDKNKLTFNCMADVDCDHKNCNTCQYKCVAKYEIENAIVLKKEEGSESK